jgi:hypothetical protein
MINFTTENIQATTHNAGCAMGCLVLKAIYSEAIGDDIAHDLYMEKVEYIGMLVDSLSCYTVGSDDCLSEEEAQSSFSSLNELIGCNCYDCLECDQCLAAYNKLQDPYLFPNKYSPVVPVSPSIEEEGGVISFS